MEIDRPQIAKNIFKINEVKELPVPNFKNYLSRQYSAGLRASLENNVPEQNPENKSLYILLVCFHKAEKTIQ